MTLRRIAMRPVATLLLTAACLLPQAATAALTFCTTDCLNKVNACKATCTNSTCRNTCNDVCGFDECSDPSLGLRGIAPNVTRRNAHLPVVTGHVQCPAGNGFDVQVTLSQPFGAAAFGSTQGACTGGEAPFTIQVHTQFGTTLIDAPVEVCALAILVGNGGILDTRQWCQDGALLIQ